MNRNFLSVKRRQKRTNDCNAVSSEVEEGSCEENEFHCSSGECVGMMMDGWMDEIGPY